MTDVPLCAVMLAGGSGKRFWPLSAADEPKQFLRVADDRSMIQATWDRLDGLIPPERRLIITADRFADQCREQLPDLPAENLIGEPEQRDTAAAAILGAAIAERRWPGAVAVTLPADHLIDPAERFQHLLRHAADMARREGALCTIGIPPTYPSTGYGYIERGEGLSIGGDLKAFRVARFAEKPDRETAEQYIDTGRFYWNAGIFIWSAATLLEEAARHMKDHHAALGRAVDAWDTDRWPAAFAEAYSQVEKISVDYGIMERTDRAAVVEATFNWSDLGGWIAVGDLLPQDGSGNQVRGQTILQDCGGTVVFNGSAERPVICLGLEDMVVAHTDNGVLVCPKGRVEQLKAAVTELYGG